MDHSSSSSAPRAQDEKEAQQASPAVGFRVFGQDADLAAIVLVYFVQGALGLSSLATSFFLKDELGLQPSELALLGGAASLPWLVKPLWGFLSDSVPLLGYRRRSYLVLAGGLGCCGWLALAAPGCVTSPPTALAALLATSLATAVSDVVVDSLVVERTRAAPAATAGTLQSLCWGASSVGTLATALLSGSLVQHYGPRPVFLFTAAFPLLVALVAPLVRDEAPLGGQGALSLGAQAQRLAATFSAPQIYQPALFLFLWQAAPSPDAALFFFTTEQLHFTPEFLGRAKLAGACASLAGVWLYNSYLKRVPIATIFRSTAVLGATLGCTQLLLVTGLNRQLGISDQAFALSDTVVLTALGRISFLPTLVLAARICPEGVEATLFAALMSVFNAAGVASGAGGAALTAALGVKDGNFDNLPALILICNGLSLASLPFLRLLDSVPGLGEAEQGVEDVELHEIAAPTTAAHERDPPDASKQA